MADVQPTRDRPEEWRSVLGYEGAYEVSGHGRVRSLDREFVNAAGRRDRVAGRMMTLSTEVGGYKYIRMTSKNVREHGKVHRLVLEAFVGPRPAGMECRHLDGDPANNHLENLAWGTSKENGEDMTRHGTCHETKKTHCPRGHRLVVPNLVRSTWEKRGYRDCLACARARAHVSYHKDQRAHFEQIADDAYKRIMS